MVSWGVEGWGKTEKEKIRLECRMGKPENK